MATSIHPSLSCLLPFYTIPIFPLLNRRIFNLLVSVLFFGCTLHINFYYLKAGIIHATLNLANLASDDYSLI